MNSMTILSTALFPNIDYMSAILNADEVRIEQYETYKKQSYRNRYHISGPNGIQSLTIPVNKNGLHNCPIKDLQISYDDDWMKLHWKTLETAYNSSPFFLYYKDDFMDILFKKHKFLWDLNQELFTTILSILDIDKQISFTTSFKKNYAPNTDNRETISPKKERLYKNYPKYHQVFNEKNGFIPNLSVIDLIFNMGNESIDYLMNFNSI